MIRRLTSRCINHNHRAILDGLAKVGFKTNLGLHGAGIMSLFLERGGGYYIGACTSGTQRR